MSKPTYKELKAQAEKLALEAEALRLEELKEVAVRVARELNEYQITIEDLKAAGYKVGTASNTAKPIKTPSGKGMKYQDPSNPTNVWTGIGRMPSWLKTLIDAGQSKEKFKIA